MAVAKTTSGPPPVPTSVADKVMAMKDYLSKREDQIAGAGRASGLAASDLLGSLLAELRRNEGIIMKCTPDSVFRSALSAASYGLTFGPHGHCYLVPRGDVATFELGYAGMAHLLYRSGDVAHYVSEVVRANDQFTYEEGLSPVLVHRPDLARNSDTIGAYAAIRMNNGGSFQHWMSKAELERVRDRYSAAYRDAEANGKKNSPWHTEPLQMWKKTVMKALLKRSPLNIYKADDENDDDAPQTVIPVVARAARADEVVQILEKRNGTEALNTRTGENIQLPAETGVDQRGIPDSAPVGRNVEGPQG